MTTMNDFVYTDDVDDILASVINDLQPSILRSEFKNAETLSATRTLADTDTPIQRLNCNGANRIVKMPTANTTSNHPYFIVNSTSSGTYTLTVQNNGATETFAVLNPNEFVLMLPDGNGDYEAVNRPFGRILSPSQITANQNDYNPSGAGAADVLRLTSDAARDITGFGFPAGGKTILVLNVGSNNIVLKDESASSTAANRFALNADVTLAADQASMLWYDTTSSRWRVIGGTGSGSSTFFDIAVHARQTVDQTAIATSTNTVVVFPQEDKDVNGYFTGSTGKFLPTANGGTYEVKTHVSITSLADGKTLWVGVRKNGTTFRWLGLIAAGAATTVGVGGSVKVYLNGSTDYVEIILWHNHGSNRDTYSGSTDDVCWIDIVRVSDQNLCGW